MYFPTGEYRRGGLQAVDVTVSPTQITPRPDTMQYRRRAETKVHVSHYNHLYLFPDVVSIKKRNAAQINELGAWTSPHPLSIFEHI